MRGKTYKKIKETLPAEAVSLDAAVDLLKQHARAKFDETVEIHIRLGIDPEKSDQTVRGSVALPGGTVKKQKIVVFTDSPSDVEALVNAGATTVGGEELIAEILKSGALEADVTIATPAMMPKVAKVARILGPKGLMPNPKIGTVSPKPLEMVQKLMSGLVSFKMDQSGNIHAAVAKLSWDKEKIILNANAFIQAVKAARPQAAKGEFLKGVYIKSTMGPSLRLAL